MATRIRYKSTPARGIKLSQEFAVLGTVYQVELIETGLSARIVIRISDTTILSDWYRHNTLTGIKRFMKNELKNLGVKFDSEVRRKRTQKQAIEHALKEKE